MKKRDERGPLSDYFRAIGRYAPLDRDEELELLRQYCQTRDPQVAKRLASANLRFVVAVARSYQKSTGMDLEELVQQGNLGLLDALHRFEDSRNVRLLSYAHWRIRAAIERHIREHIALSRHEVGDADVSDEPDESIDMDHHAGEDWILRGTALIKAFRDTVDGRSAVLLDARLCAEAPKTLEEVGREFGVCRERVRKLEMALMDRLRTYVRSGLSDHAANVVHA